MANTSSAQVAASLERIFAAGGSVSLYMGFGGTNFAFWNGANTVLGSQPPYVSSIQSYDYDAPVSESGQHGYGSDGVDKFAAIRAVMQRHSQRPLPVEPPVAAPQPFATINAPAATASLWDVEASIGRAFALQTALPMEPLGQSVGFISYEYANVALARGLTTLQLPTQWADRALVFVNATQVGVALVGFNTSVSWSQPTAGTCVLRILVENMGRVNFGPALPLQTKGMRGVPLLNGTALAGPLTAHSLSLEETQLRGLVWGACKQAPCFARFDWNVTAPRVPDTFLRFDGWSKGVVFVNGFNLGRYWQAMVPQRTMFVSRHLLRPGANSVVLLELERMPADPQLAFSERAIFWH